jgi:hypothetical protein
MSLAKSIVIAYDGSLQIARALQAFVFSELWKLRTVNFVVVKKERTEASELGEIAGN